MKLISKSVTSRIRCAEQKGFFLDEKLYRMRRRGECKRVEEETPGRRRKIKTDTDSCYRGFIHLGSIKFAAGRTIIASRFVLSCPPPPSISLRSREFSVKTFVALLIRLIPLPVQQKRRNFLQIGEGGRANGAIACREHLADQK